MLNKAWVGDDIRHNLVKFIVFGQANTAIYKYNRLTTKQVNGIGLDARS